jgi:hypothetical protein
VAQKASYNAAFLRDSVDPEDVRREKIQRDVVIVPGVERDVSPRFSHGADDIQCLVAIEWRNLDRNNIFNLSEFAPESVGKYASTHSRLQVKTYERDDFRHLSAVSYKGCIIRVAHSGQAQQTRAVSKTRQQLRLSNSLHGLSADASDAD